VYLRVSNFQNVPSKGVFFSPHSRVDAGRFEHCQFSTGFLSWAECVSNWRLHFAGWGFRDLFLACGERGYRALPGLRAHPKIIPQCADRNIVFGLQATSEVF